MELIELDDNGLAFEATLLRATKPTCTVLFAVGSGGHPSRHEQLITTLFENQCTVIAPHFNRLVSPIPSREDLIDRARKLKIALDYISTTNTPTVGIGHSIGATLLLSLVGGKIWLSPQDCLSIPYDERLTKLSLFAPPTGFFMAPNALDKINIPLQVWAGTLDKITPKNQAEFLKNNLSSKVYFDLKIVEEAGHFSFMNSLPPGVIDPMVDRTAFLNTLAVETFNFLVN